VHVIAKHPKLSTFWAAHPDAEKPLLAWYRIARKAEWRNFAEVRESFPHADVVGILTVFNIGGNKYRLVVEIQFDRGRVFVQSVMTHEEYSRGRWKDG
jgi:mRNA interferase HigB